MSREATAFQGAFSTRDMEDVLNELNDAVNEIDEGLKELNN